MLLRANLPKASIASLRGLGCLSRKQGIRLPQTPNALVSPRANYMPQPLNAEAKITRTEEFHLLLHQQMAVLELLRPVLSKKKC